MTEGILVVITGPSGVGKSVLVSALLKKLSESARMITATTREPRPGEVHGKDYYFMSRDEFETAITRGEFLEWEENYGKLYGTLSTELNEQLASHKFIFTAPDTRGARSLKKSLPTAITIFLTPDSMDNLKKRLEGRLGNDDIEERLQQATDKINQARDFDYIVINREGMLSKTVEEVISIIKQKTA